jgi:predicted DNA-binding transcriptional regulator AlpA
MDKEILTTQDCCALLAVSESNLRTMMNDKNNPIPYSQLSSGSRGTVRFLKSSVIEWVKSREVKRG